MKHVIYKAFTIGAYEKEEKWLNEMSAKGMLLTDISPFRYVFEEGTPGKYIYRLELLEHLPSHPESIAYIKFLEETGIEYVGSCVRWIYLRRPASDGAFEIYSDIKSKLMHLKRITAIANTMSIVFAIVAIIFAWEAVKQYLVYSQWIQRGYASRPYYNQCIFVVLLYLLLIAILQLVVLPIRRSMRRIKSIRRLSE